jgi:predicted RNA-binding Zn-ribbon protein involved in translation (DUF1610 family)
MSNRETRSGVSNATEAGRHQESRIAGGSHMPARTCSVCKSTVRVPDGKVGQSFTCPECGEPITASGSSAKMKRDRARPRKPSKTIAVLITALSVAFGAAALLLAWHWLVRRS